MSQGEKVYSSDLTGGNGQRPLVGDDYLTRYALAKELGVSVHTIKKWDCRRMGPPRIKIGKTILYRRTAVREWLDGREERPSRRR